LTLPPKVHTLGNDFGNRAELKQKETLMLRRIYSIRDSKAELYSQPMFAHTHGEAERNFTELVNDEKSKLFQFSEDFDLYHIGDLDDSTGKINSPDTPQHIAKAAHIKRPNIQ